MDWVFAISTSMIAALLLSFLASSRKPLLSSWRLIRKRRSLQRRLEAAGLTNFYATRDDFARYRSGPLLLDYLCLAQRSVHIAACWLRQENEMDQFAQAIAELVKPPKNIEITIAIINPMAPYIDALARYLDMAPQQLIRSIQQSLYKLYKARERLSGDERPRFRLKVYDTIPVASVIMLDAGEKNGRVQIDFKAYRAPKYKSFVFEFSGHGNYLYDLCSDAWVGLIEAANDFDPQKHLQGFTEAQGGNFRPDAG